MRVKQKKKEFVDSILVEYEARNNRNTIQLQLHSILQLILYKKCGFFKNSLLLMF